jgi:hypothetical protein
MNFNFQGVDRCLQISLFEYGFICAYNKPDHDFFIVYRNEHNTFDVGYLSEHSLNEIVNGNDWANDADVKSFLSYCGTTKKEWLTSPIVNKISTLLSYWGSQNLLGSSYSTGMEKEECIERYKL